MDANGVNKINISGVNNLSPALNKPAGVMPTGKTFGDALSRAVDVSEIGNETGLRFSKHAATRINSRQVDLSPEQLRRVEEGVKAALVKGVSDSLVLVDGYALVVNTRSGTVVTAMDSSQNGGVFTNINGAVVV